MEAKFSDGALVMILGDEPRPAFVYENGEKTQKRVRDRFTNADVSGVNAVIATSVLGVAEGRVLVPDALAEGLRAGVIVRLTGASLAGDVAAARSGFGVTVRVQGVEHVEHVGAFEHTAQPAASARTTKAGA